MNIKLNIESKILRKLQRAIDKQFVKQKRIDDLIQKILNDWIEKQEDL
jgi:transcriptional regulator NrdR family protein